MMSFFSRKSLITPLRKHSVISWRLPNGMWIKLPFSSKPPSSTMACQFGFHRKKSPKD